MKTKTPSQQAGADLRPALLGMAWVTVCWVPLLIEQVGTLLERPHYQFVVLLPFAAALLARSRWQELARDQVRPGYAKTTAVLAGGVLVLVGAATLLRSPWLGFVGYLFSLLAIVYGVGGRGLVRAWLPAGLLLGICVPLPFNLDERLVTELRGIVTDWTSHVLHLVGVLHLVQGNVIELPGKAFFVADACTGIHSLFVVVAAAVFVGFLFERSLLRVILLAACAVGLVLIENTSRLTGVVLAYRWGIDISEGWPHEAFGVLLFGATLLLVLSADQLIAFLLPGKFRLWRRKNRTAAGNKSRDGRKSKSAAMPSRATLGVLGGLVAVLGVIQWRQFPLPVMGNTAEGGKDVVQVPELGVDFVPQTIEGYHRRSYHLDIHPINVNYLSDYSQVWEYSGDDARLKLSLDYPYPGVHDLCLCYKLTGWEIQRKQFRTAGGQVPAGDLPPIPLVFAEMDKPVDGKAYLFFSYFNADGEQGVRLYPLHEPSAAERLRRRINSFLGTQPAAPPTAQGPTEWNAALAGPVFQVQVLVQSPGELADEELARVERFFVTARQELISRYQSLQGRQATP